MSLIFQGGGDGASQSRILAPVRVAVLSAGLRFCYGVVFCCLMMVPVSALAVDMVPPSAPASVPEVAVSEGDGVVAGSSGVDSLSAVTDSPWDLDRLIRVTMTKNPQVLRKQALYQAAKSSSRAAFFQFFPAPYVDAVYDGTTHEHYGIFGIEQPLWSGGKLSSNWKAARSSALSSKVSVEETQLALGIQVVDEYQALLSYHARVNAQQSAVRILEKFAAMMDHRVRDGVSAPTEKALVDSRLVQARSLLSLYQTKFRTSLTQLSQLVGRPLSGKEIAYATDRSMQAPLVLDSLMNRMEQMSPVLVRSGIDIETAKHRKSLQRAQLLPTISLKVERETDLFSENNSYAENAVRVEMAYTFGGGLPALANIQSAGMQVIEAVQLQEASRRELQARLINEYDSCLTALTRYAQSCEAISGSEQVLLSYTRLFMAGKRSWLDVLNAAQEKSQNDGERGDILASYWSSWYRLRLYSADPSFAGVDVLPFAQ